MTFAEAVFVLLVLLQAKHFLADFVFQPAWMYKNKGTFGHPGGIVHALVHGLATCAILALLPWQAKMTSAGITLVICYIGMAEFAIHYIVDWGKVNWNNHYNWGPTTSENFWKLLGFDQLLHQWTYIFIVVVYFKVWVAFT